MVLDQHLHSERRMHPRTTTDRLRRQRQKSASGVGALERRISELEQLATSQRHQLEIQFERIAQLQAEWDVLRIRFGRS
jgi:hypothetical protein